MSLNIFRPLWNPLIPSRNKRRNTEEHGWEISYERKPPFLSARRFRFAERNISMLIRTRALILVISNARQDLEELGAELPFREYQHRVHWRSCFTSWLSPVRKHSLIYTLNDASLSRSLSFEQPSRIKCWRFFRARRCRSCTWTTRARHVTFSCVLSWRKQKRERNESWSRVGAKETGQDFFSIILIPREAISQNCTRSVYVFCARGSKMLRKLLNRFYL